MKSIITLIIAIVLLAAVVIGLVKALVEIKREGKEK
jgi:hypothetical protein